jgi:hypothetical protein
MVNDATTSGMFVSAHVAFVATPVTAAVALYGPPATVFAVATTSTTPSAVVVVVPAKVADATPVPTGAANVTGTPATTFPYWSFTVATRCCVKAFPTVCDCAVPVVVMLAAAPAVFVTAKVTGEAPPSEAVTEYPPATVLAVAVTLACPVLPLVAVAGTVAEAPLEGAE